MRKQVSSSTVRFCKSCLVELASGTMPGVLADSIAEAVEKVRSDAWGIKTNKRK